MGRYGVPVVAETIAATAAEAAAAAVNIKFPVVLKGIGEGLLHKTESGLVHLNLADENPYVSRRSKSFRLRPVRKFWYSLKFAGIGNSWPGFFVIPNLVRQFFSD